MKRLASFLRRVGWLMLAAFCAWALWRMVYVGALLFYVEEVMP